MAERLVDPTLGTLELTEVNGYRVQQIDLGFPAARAAVVDRVNTNGTDDHTAFYGARAVAIRVVVDQGPGVSRRQALDRLRAYASPARRPDLYFNDDDLGGVPDRVVRLRGDQLGAPLVDPFGLEAQVQWVAPAGIIESAAEHTVSVPAAPVAEAGRSYPRTYPIVYPEISAIGSVGVVNEGTEPAAPVLRLWGPCTDPSVINLETFEQLSLTGVALTAEQYVEVDVREATVRLQGRADQNFYTQMSLDSTLWWLQPGENRVRYSPATYSGNSRAETVWRDAWI